MEEGKTIWIYIFLYYRKNYMNFKWKYVTFSHHFLIYSSAWIWVVLLQISSAEVPAFSGLKSSYVGCFKKTTKKPKQQLQNTPAKQTSPHPTAIFPALELLSELSFKFKGSKWSKFLSFSFTSGNIHPVTEVWAHSIICSPWCLQGSVVRTGSRAHCAKRSFLRRFSLWHSSMDLNLV